jgi:predicted extracellular nuclease
MKRLGKILALILALPLALPGSFQTLDRTPICEIQGSGFTANHLGETVRVRGIVFADLDQTGQKGLFIQEPNCDTRSYTSDGIYIYLGERVNVAAPGDQVDVTGVVQEYYGMTEIVAAPQNVFILSHANPLPTALDLNPPLDNNSASYYFENREAMRVRLDAGLVVGPTDSDERAWLVRTDLGIERVVYGDPGGTGEVICVGDTGLYPIAPDVKVGDRVTGLIGALQYRFGAYCLALTAAPQVQAALITPPPVPGPAMGLRIATLNLQNLFDTSDDPATEDTVLSPTEYLRRLEKRARAIHDALGEPAILAVQEAENLNVLAALVDRPEIQADYRVLLVEGPDIRGIDIALLYQIDRVQVYEYRAHQGCTALVDGLGPDGNGDVYNPQNSLTCDRDGDGILDGNRLFSRPPLAARLRLTLPGAVTWNNLWVIANHWKSKVEDGYTVQYTLPRRLEQAEFVAALAQEIIRTDPETSLIVLGDLNDHPDSLPVQEMLSQGLKNPIQSLPRTWQYTYIYNGISQSLDYILTSMHPPLYSLQIQPVRINADYPASLEQETASFYRSSDHDPLWIEIVAFPPQVFLPMLSR